MKIIPYRYDFCRSMCSVQYLIMPSGPQCNRANADVFIAQRDSAAYNTSGEHSMNSYKLR